MAQQTFTGRKRVRKFFGHIKEVAEMPNLIEVQKASYDQFLMVKDPPGGRSDEGLQAVFKSVFPIRDFSNTSQLDFVAYEFDPPKYDVDECRQRGMTYAAPLKVTLRLIVFDIDEETGAKSVKDIKEQDVYMGDIPLMTMNGTFIINGTERVIVSQLHRSPGAFFHSEDKTLYVAQIIPYRGSWVEFEYDSKNLLYVRIDRKRKFLASVFLRALGLRGADEIIRSFYSVEKLCLKNGSIHWGVSDSLVGLRAARDIVVPGENFTVQSGKKITKNAVEALKRANVPAVEISDAELEGAFAAADVVDPSTGEVILEANEPLEDLKSFILPGGTEAAARLHVARSVCRRAERAMVSLHAADAAAVEADLLIYINRLSDLLFVLARVVNLRADTPEIEW